MELYGRLFLLPCGPKHRGISRECVSLRPGLSLLVHHSLPVRKSGGLMAYAPAHERENAMRILVVDDDRSTCHLLHSILVGEGYDCQTARTIEEAEQVLSDFSPELALVDIYMGETSGVL